MFLSASMQTFFADRIVIIGENKLFFQISFMQTLIHFFYYSLRCTPHQKQAEAI